MPQGRNSMCQRSRGSRAIKNSAKDHSGSGHSCDQHGSVETWQKHVINSVYERENLQMICESAGGLTDGEYLSLVFAQLVYPMQSSTNWRPVACSYVRQRAARWQEYAKSKPMTTDGTQHNKPWTAANLANLIISATRLRSL